MFSPVNARSAQTRIRILPPGLPGARTCRAGAAPGAHGERVDHGLPWHLHASRRLRGLGLRRGRRRGRRPARVAQPGGQRRRRVLPGRRPVDRSARRSSSTRSSPTTTRIKYVQHYSNTVQPFIYKLTSYWGGLDGSIMFWAFLLAVFGSIAVYVNRERHRELMPYVVAIISVGADVLPVPDGRPQQPVLDLPDDGAGRRPRPEPAAPERLHGHPPAGALRRASSG